MEYYDSIQAIKRPAAICIGNFDGLHKGHQALVTRTREAAVRAGLTSVVLSFYPHPVSVLRNETVKTILTRQEKITLLSRMDIDCYVELPFTKAFSEITPQHFVESLASGGCCRALFVGEGFRFGKNQSGDLNTLTEYGVKLGIDVTGVEHLNIGGGKISTANLKASLAANDFEGFEALAGRKYSVTGIVERGKKIGRTLSYNTANIWPPEEKLLPGDGVYITYTHARGIRYESMTNIGINPTVGGSKRRVETHLFGFGGDLYGQSITVEFLSFLRNEISFDSIEELKSQLVLDEQSAKTFFITNV